MRFGHGAGSSAARAAGYPHHSLRGKSKVFIFGVMDAMTFIATPFLSLRRLLLARPLLRLAR